MIWQSLKPAIWMIGLAAAALLFLASLIAQGWTLYIVPPPENTAEQLVSALGAHRYTGASNQLSRDLKQQIDLQALRSLVKSIEQSPAKGIQDAHGQNAQEQADQASADVLVTLNTNQKISITLPLVKENGVWKVASIDPIRALAGGK